MAQGWEFKITVRMLDDASSREELLAAESFAASEIEGAVRDGIALRFNEPESDTWQLDVEVQSDVITR